MLVPCPWQCCCLGLCAHILPDHSEAEQRLPVWSSGARGLEAGWAPRVSLSLAVPSPWGWWCPGPRAQTSSGMLSPCPEPGQLHLRLLQAQPWQKATEASMPTCT